MLTKIYTPIWSKYRPVILKMMVDAANEPQSYQLFNHEFKALNPTGKGFSFSLEVSSGKATKGLKDSAIAQDLWEVLQLSPKAGELISNATFCFSMDRQFILYIDKINLI